MYGNDRAEMREVFFRAWRHYRENLPLQGVEKVVVDVAREHPEYHALLETGSGDRDYLPELGESNPFLHMGLHVAIAEQLAIDQPPGVRRCYQQLRERLPDAHAVEHAMMECLGETVWRAAREQRVPDQAAYLRCLDRLARRA
ncbi:MAG: DUF1841 family protein [Sulfurifustaceae bacterium]